MTTVGRDPGGREPLNARPIAVFVVMVVVIWAGSLAIGLEVGRARRAQVCRPTGSAQDPSRGVSLPTVRRRRGGSPHTRPELLSGRIAPANRVIRSAQLGSSGRFGDAERWPSGRRLLFDSHKSVVSGAPVGVAAGVRDVLEAVGECQANRFVESLQLNAPDLKAPHRRWLRTLPGSRDPLSLRPSIWAGRRLLP